MDTANMEYDDLNCYNWCNNDESGDVWYHIVKFWVSDSSDKIVPLHETLQVLQKDSTLLTTKKLCLYGEILPINTSYEDKKHRMCIRTQIVDYQLNFGRNSTDIAKGFWFKDGDDAWYKLEPPFNHEYNTFISQTMKDAPAYNWVAKPTQEVWRHIREYAIRNNKGEMVDPDRFDAHSVSSGTAGGVFEGSYVLTGVLVPKLGEVPCISVSVSVVSHAIDFGLTKNDPQRGLWVCDVYGHWYKLEQPHHASYALQAESASNRCDQFLRVYDALVYRDKTTSVNVQSVGKFFISLIVD
jgi:hypothetical protein